MCLFLGGMGGMGGQEPPFPLTEKAKMWKTYLQILSLVHFTLAILVMTMGKGGSFFSLMTPLILCCATCSYQYCCLMFYMFYALIDLFGYIDPVGLAL